MVHLFARALTPYERASQGAQARALMAQMTL
jgi:hypothetical protein